jgi:hypothetical protein
VIAVLAVWAVVGVVLFAAAVAALALVCRVTSLRPARRPSPQVIRGQVEPLRRWTGLRPRTRRRAGPP